MLSEEAIYHNVLMLR